MSAIAHDAPTGEDGRSVSESVGGLPQTAATDWSKAQRLGGLRRFALAITLLNVIGHMFLGFETSWAHPLAALATGYTLEGLLEWIEARAQGRKSRFDEGLDFFLSAHISSLAVSMLLYPGGRLWPVVFATAVAVGSKVIFRFEIDGRTRHVLNPSNTGIALTLALFPQVGIAPPYQFTEVFQGIGNWIFPALLIVLGTFLNLRYTRRLPVIGAWLGVFALQAFVRHLLFGAALVPALMPMTGIAFLLFTFYMVTDPPTSPSATRSQIAFGASVAAVYGLLTAFHIVFGLFFSLVIVCTARGCWLFFRSSQRAASLPSAASASARQASG